MEVAIKMSFDAAHILGGYDGKCGNLHGHTYKIEVVVEGEPDVNKMGMVIDYNRLKPVVRSVVDQYDHAFIAGDTWKDNAIAEQLCSLGLKVKSVQNYSTTESIAKQIFSELVVDVKNLNVDLVSVRISETDSTYAEVRYGE